MVGLAGRVGFCELGPVSGLMDGGLDSGADGDTWSIPCCAAAYATQES